MREILFYILDKKENIFIIIHEESEHGYNGIGISKNSDPTEMYIAKTFISEQLERYDFSKEEPVLI